MQEDTHTARAALPTVTRVLPGAGQSFSLELEDGRSVTVQKGTRAALSPLQGDGLAVLAYQWGRADADVYAVPAPLLPVLLPYFPATAD